MVFGKKVEITQADLEKFSQPAKMELVVLTNIEKFLRRVKDISGDEAYAFVESREYILARIDSLKRMEMKRLEAMAKIEAEKNAPKPPVAPVEAPKPALTVVKPEEPPKSN